MNKLIEKLIDSGIEKLMDENRNVFIQTDEIYINDRKDEKELEQYYENLNLTREQRMIINDYMACTSTVNQRYADLSYICGIKDAVSMLVSLGLIKGVESNG